VDRATVRVLTDWSTADPDMARTLAMIQEMPDSTPERHEAEAFLHMTMARAAWRRADELRRNERYRRQPRVAGPEDGRRRAVKGTCVACNTKVRLRLDGTCWKHDAGSGAARTRAYGPREPRCEGSGMAPQEGLAPMY